MPIIQIDEKEILTTKGPKKVSQNGQIAIGRKHAGKWIKAYVVEVEKPRENNNGGKEVYRSPTSDYKSEA